MPDEVTNIGGFLIELTSLHLPPTPHPPCATMGEYDDNLLSLTYRSNLVKVCKQFVQSNNQFFCSTFRWEFGKSNNIREQNAEKDKRRKLEGVSIAQIVFTRQTGRDYRFFFECLAQETSASVFKNNPQLLQENAPPPLHPYKRVRPHKNHENRPRVRGNFIVLNLLSVLSLLSKTFLTPIFPYP